MSIFLQLLTGNNFTSTADRTMYPVLYRIYSTCHMAIQYVLPVHLSVPYGLLTQKQKCRKIKKGTDAPQARESGVPIFRWKGQRSRSQDVQNFHSNLASCLLTANQSSAHCWLHCGHGLEFLNVTQPIATGHISCRHHHHGFLYRRENLEYVFKLFSQCIPNLSFQNTETWKYPFALWD